MLPPDPGQPQLLPELPLGGVRLRTATRSDARHGPLRAGRRPPGQAAAGCRRLQARRFVRVARRLQPGGLLPEPRDGRRGRRHDPGAPHGLLLARRVGGGFPGSAGLALLVARWRGEDDQGHDHGPANDPDLVDHALRQRAEGVARPPDPAAHSSPLAGR